MSQLETAVTAAFVMEGMASHQFGQVQEYWQLATRHGAVELITEVMRYVPAVIALREAGNAIHGSHGSFHDEVSLPFGQWMSCEIIAAGGTLPERKDAIGYIASLTRCSFVIDGELPTAVESAIDAAERKLIAAQ